MRFRYNETGLFTNWSTKTLNLRAKRLTLIVAIATFITFLDQLSKFFIRTELRLKETWTPIAAIGSWFRIVHWRNSGVAFGLFPGYGWLMTLIGLVVLTLVVIFYKPVLSGAPWLAVAIGLQYGGAIGNMIDRINPGVGYVVDFIWIGNFPVFNFADTAVTIGAGILLLCLWLEDETNRSEIKETTESESHEQHI